MPTIRQWKCSCLSLLEKKKNSKKKSCELCLKTELQISRFMPVIRNVPHTRATVETSAAALAGAHKQTIICSQMIISKFMSRRLIADDGELITLS